MCYVCENRVVDPELPAVIAGHGSESDRFDFVVLQVWVLLMLIRQVVETEKRKD